MKIPAGTLLGPYQVLAAIGAGGMGEVYRAVDTRLHRDVAVKVCAERFSERFEQESRAIASLNHPNICTLHDVGPDYLVMELVEGPTLADRIRQGALPLEEALEIARQIAAALEAAHEKGIVHRDLKPGNVKIKSDGTVKVLDFGLAKMSGAPAGKPDESPTISIGITQAGVIMGTAAYMAPEQARGKPVDKRADIWAFGVVLYEMLTGEVLFEGETLTDTLASVVKEEPQWERAPVKARRLLRICLEKDPRLRLRDMGDAAKFLEDAPETPAASVAAPRRPRLAWGVAALFVLTSATLAVVHFREKPAATPQVVRFQVAPPDKTGFETYMVLSPDGRRLAFTGAGEDGLLRLWVRDLDSLESKPLAGTENPGSAFWSPDGRFLAFGDGNRLKKVDTSGGPPQTVCESPNTVGSGTWGADGVILFGGRGVGPIMRVSAAGGAPTPVTALDPSRMEAFHSFPSFLPDGRHFLYFRASPAAESNGIYVGSLDTPPAAQATKRILPSQFGAAYTASASPDAAKSSDGSILYLRDGTLLAQPFDAGRLEFDGEAIPVASSVGNTNQYGYFTASRNGVLAYKAGAAPSGSQLTWFDRGGKVLSALTAPGSYNALALSPDGTRAAASRVASQSTGLDLWLYEFARGTSTRFTFNPAPDNMPVWSPDSTRIVFSSAREGAYNLYQKLSSGAGNEEELLKSSENKFASDWSRDDILLYGAIDLKTGKAGLWMLPLKGGGKPAPYLHSDHNLQHGHFSPDNHWVVFTSDESGRNEIYVQPFPNAGDGKWMISRDGGSQPRWSRNGKELFYLSFDSKLMAVDVTASPTFQAGLPHALFPAPILGGNAASNAVRYDVTPDGKKFLINTVTGGAPSSVITVVLNWTAALNKGR